MLLNDLIMITYSELTRIREVLRFGYTPTLSSPSKIIFDKTTGDMYVVLYLLKFKLKLITHSKISGFSWAAPIQPDTEWNDYNFVKFSLVLISPKQDKDFPTMANDLKDIQNNGWRW